MAGKITKGVFVAVAEVELDGQRHAAEAQDAAEYVRLNVLPRPGRLRRS